MGRPFVHLGIWILVSPGVLASCSDDASGGGDGSTTTSTTSGSTTDLSTTSTTSTTGDASSSSTTGPTGPRTCKRACDLPATCCPADQPDCPSMIYPGNYGCFNDVCVLPQCMTNAECETVDPRLSCEAVGGLTICVEICETDADCGDTRSCQPTADDGRTFCRTSCTDGVIACPPGQECDDATGQCLCENDDQCGAGFLCRP